jgi:hypothetical protein
MSCVKLHGPCSLGDAVSSARCPALRKLTVYHAWGLGNFAVHSDSLLEIDVKHLHGLEQLTVMAPALKRLCAICCLSKPSSTANISAPQLVSLEWAGYYDPRFTQLGKMDNLQRLRTSAFLVYGQHDFGHELNSNSLRLIRRFELIPRLSFMLIYVPVSSFLCEPWHHCVNLESKSKFKKIAIGIQWNSHLFFFAELSPWNMA